MEKEHGSSKGKRKADALAHLLQDLSSEGENTDDGQLLPRSCALYAFSPRLFIARTGSPDDPFMAEPPAPRDKPSKRKQSRRSKRRYAAFASGLMILHIAQPATPPHLGAAALSWSTTLARSARVGTRAQELTVLRVSK